MGAVCQAEFHGPDDLAKRILDRRRESQEEGEQPSFGEISADGVRRLIQIAYYSSQSPNEGRYPRLTLLVPAGKETVSPLIQFEPEDLTVQTLRRIGPTLASQDYALLVREHVQTLQIRGIAQLRSSLRQIDLGDSAATPLDRPRGFYIEIFGPGDLRARERGAHRLQAGHCRREMSFMNDDWFREWYDAAAMELFEGWTPGTHPSLAGWTIRPDFAIKRVWLAILLKAASLRHGGCFVIVPEPPSAIRPTFTASECEIGAAIVEHCEALRYDDENPQTPLTGAEARRRTRLRERLLSLIDAAAHLSSTDGCVVFNRQLRLESFGSMIEVADARDPGVKCFRGDSTTPISEDEIRCFGARRRSAIQLCRACPDAMAFVISQDGDLRIFVRRDDGVRFYDNAVLWNY
jgi:hypothetical protein